MSGLFKKYKDEKVYATPKYELNTQVNYNGQQAVIVTIWRGSHETDYYYAYTLFIYKELSRMEKVPEEEIVLWTNG